MPKTKLLVLTKLVNKVNEKGQTRITEALEKKSQLEEEGLTPEFYDKLGLIPPKSKDRKGEIDEEGNIRLEIDEIDDIAVDVIFRLSEFQSAEEGDYEGSIVTLKSGLEFDVMESAIEIQLQIEELEMTLFDKIKNYINPKQTN